MPTPRRKPRPKLPPKKHPNADLVAEGARACPICSQPMQTSQRGDDAIDVCAEHGVWLDRFELERMFARRSKATGRRIERIRDEAQVAGFCWGLLL